MRVQCLFSAICLLFLGSQCAGQSSYFREYERKQQVVDTFEKALIANPTNIFVLRNIFFPPSNDYPSSSFSIVYHVKLHGNVTFNTSTQWCRTSVSIEASPLMMLTLSSGVMLFLHRGPNKFLFPPSVELSLNISNSTIEGGFNEEDIKYAVEYITPWFQRYATIESEEKILQQLLSNKDKGYVCQHNSYNLWLVLASAGIVQWILILATGKMYQVSKMDEFEQRMNLSIILSIGILGFITNITEIVLNTMVLNTMVKAKQSASPGSDLSLLDHHTTTKWIAIIASIAIFIITAIITGILLCSCNKSTKLPSFSICCIKVKCLYPFIIASFFTFVLIEGANIIPIFLMLLNEPLVTISILVYIVTFFGAGVLMSSLYIFNKFRGGKWLSVESIISLLLLFLISNLTAIYLGTLKTATREESPNLVTYVITLIPSILSIIVGYKAKEKLFKYKTTGTNKEEEHDSEIATGNNEGEQQQQHSEIDIESEQTEEHVARGPVASTRFLETEV